MATKTVLITGTSAGGIGSALAFAFQKRGLRVFATARNTSKIDPALADLPNVELLSLDVTSDASIAAAAAEVKERTGGKLDFLVNNSGVGYVMPFLDLDMDEAKKLFDMNFWGVLAATKAFAPMLIEAKGAIVNISSIAAVAYSPYESRFFRDSRFPFPTFFRRGFFFLQTSPFQISGNPQPERNEDAALY